MKSDNTDAICKNCGDKASFTRAVWERSSKGWCAGCYNTWKRTVRTSLGEEWIVDHGLNKEGHASQKTGTASPTKAGFCVRCGTETLRLNPPQLKEFSGWCSLCTVQHHQRKKAAK